MCPIRRMQADTQLFQRIRRGPNHHTPHTAATSDKTAYIDSYVAGAGGSSIGPLVDLGSWSSSSMPSIDGQPSATTVAIRYQVAGAFSLSLSLALSIKCICTYANDVPV